MWGVSDSQVVVTRFGQEQKLGRIFRAFFGSTATSARKLGHNNNNNDDGSFNIYVYIAHTSIMSTSSQISTPFSLSLSFHER